MRFSTSSSFGVSQLSDIEADPLAPLRASPLWQAVFKLDWADTMFAHALHLANEFVQNGDYGFREESDATGERLILHCARLPKELPLAVGSGIHSLRSSLDAAVSALMGGMTGKHAERVNFPFHQTERELRAEFDARVSHCARCGNPRQTKAKLHDLAEHLPEFVDLVFDTFKPWRDGNLALWSLNKLDNFQKHRMLLLAVAVTRGGVDYYDSSTSFSSFKANEWIIPPGTEVVVAESKQMIVETGERRLAINFTLSKELPYGGEPLFDVLGELYKLVHSVLTTLHAHFDGHKALS